MLYWVRPRVGVYRPSNCIQYEISFLKKGSFEKLLLDYAEKIKQPNTVGEFASLPAFVGGLKPAPAGKEFKGPLQFFIGEYDYAFCRGDCKGTYDVEKIKTSLYLAAKSVEVYLQPKTGHGLTLSSNATAGYRVMFEFLHASGL